MASVGHVAVGLCVARFKHGAKLPWRAALAWSALSLCPDADVLGMALRVPYASPWGHRGFTHSVAMAVVMGAMCGAWTRSMRVTALAILTVVSHPLLDALTNGGLGVALAWPWSNARFFAPWHPIPVSPMGMGFLSVRGLTVAAVEALWFSPAWVYALWPRTIK